MTTDQIFSPLQSLRFDVRDWKFIDLRVDIPPQSFGSDAANPHTQYSNAVAILEKSGVTGVGACFTLGAGNEFLCSSARETLQQLNGLRLADLLTHSTLAEVLVNPRQIRWLSPWSGLPMMAGGLIINTLIDWASKISEMPAWKWLARLSPETLMTLLSTRHLTNQQAAFIRSELTQSYEHVENRIANLEESSLPAYFTTWFGQTVEEVVTTTSAAMQVSGFRTIKLKIGPQISTSSDRLSEILNGLPDIEGFAVDANQTLNYSEACDWLQDLSARGCLWLEEPFAPDNTSLFEALQIFRSDSNFECEIASGENCPNTHVADQLMRSGVQRFQPDPCRMFGLPDTVVAAGLAKFWNRKFTPHAGGAGLDEMSPHIQLLNLARINTDQAPSATLTENVGFCSHLYLQPSIVREGSYRVPSQPGFLVGFASDISSSFIPSEEGITWVEF